MEQGVDAKIQQLEMFQTDQWLFNCHFDPVDLTRCRPDKQTDYRYKKKN